MDYSITLCGDRALIINLSGEKLNQLNQAVHALDRFILSAGITGLLETAPGYDSLVVVYDPLSFKMDEIDLVVRKFSSLEHNPAPWKSRLLEIPVRYGGECGPDLKDVADLHGLTPAQVVEIHVNTIYQVYMIGFTPGFSYMGEVSELIATPRLATPRALVRAGSVGIAGNQTGIYPSDSPGGWRIIGRTQTVLFDIQREPPCLFSPGDRVKFVPEEVIV